MTENTGRTRVTKSTSINESVSSDTGSYRFGYHGGKYHNNHDESATTTTSKDKHVLGLKEVNYHSKGISMTSAEKGAPTSL